jgi:two-component system, OmpR family, response regulator RegX3
VRLLIVEDNQRVSAALQSALTKQGHEVLTAGTGKAALEMLDQQPDVVLLDLGLPDCDGFTVCAAIRATSSVPLVVTTARGDPSSCVRALDLGADDYVVKPYNLAELLARARAVLRRGRPAAAPAPTGAVPGDLILAGPIRIDLREHAVLINGQPAELSEEEFSILAALARRPGETLRFQQLADEILRVKRTALHGSIHRYMASLGQHLGVPGLVEAVDETGYRLSLELAAQESR